MLYCWIITTGVVLLNYYHRCCIVLLNYYHRCCIAELLPQVLYCWTITTGVVLLNYYHRCLLYCWTITTGVVLLNYYHRCCNALLNYYHRCRDVAGAALSSFSGPPPPSRTGLPPVMLLVTVSQSINQSIDQQVLAVHPYMYCIVKLVPHNDVDCLDCLVLYSRTITTYVHCIVEPLWLMLYCVVELLPSVLQCFDLLPHVLYCWTFAKWDAMYCWICSTNATIAVALYCWAITIDVVLLNYYHLFSDMTVSTVFSEPTIRLQTNLISW